MLSGQKQATLFKKGCSGNPAGRPRGTQNPSTKLRKQIADALPEIINTLVESAKGGDVGSASLLLSRALPPLRPESLPQPVEDKGTSVDRAERIAIDVLAGVMSPTTAAELMALLANQAKIVETQELEQRIADLEARTA
jgi:hypothetical protein